ncbi:deoxyhypusine hydroxylase [Raphidocelis subcapitata]|uniref:Deoxyhypusine hydroxylase n=1 Tax=Raphidocelis subcapitata TaxID=307507 RepID=A0A2V0P392_9CHLO|nr:deoxyhypusine hydroxylase [Raphidocelis subcapitata]|eukprot:GBF91677.1 deoxyhypusine hydroxylase [Raphidocelis subcapitata]
MANLASLVKVAPETVASLRAKLESGAPLPEKYRVLFSLRNIEGQEAHEALALALRDPSALFRHDVAFCLGQRQDPAAIGVLQALLRDSGEHPMVRHEAGEALGAIGAPDCLAALRAHAADAAPEVAETCQLALERIEYFASHGGGGAGEGGSPYLSVDPTPPLPADTPVDALRRILLDPKQPMFERYRALFALRNRGGDAAVAVLCEAFSAASALLKHEVAYVLGQLQHPRSVPALSSVLRDPREHAMVRHEAAEALGAVADPACVALLKAHAADAEPIVAHSCVVALDMLEHEASGAFEYCAAAQDGGGGAQAAAAAVEAR